MQPTGDADLSAQFFYDHLDPLTHPDAYARAPALHFICGAADDHIPPDGAERFKVTLADKHPYAAERVSLTLLPNLGHGEVCDFDIWWPIVSQQIDALRVVRTPEEG